MEGLLLLAWMLLRSDKSANPIKTFVSAVFMALKRDKHVDNQVKFWERWAGSSFWQGIRTGCHGAFQRTRFS
jgi:hypothetical protein